MKRWSFDVLVGTILSFLSYLFGEWGDPFKILFILMITDFLSGWISAMKRHSLSSDQGFWGIIKKFGIVAVVMVANLLDKISPDALEILGITIADPLRGVAIYAYIVNESISIVENLGEIGVPFPHVVTSWFAKLKSDKLADSNVVYVNC